MQAIERFYVKQVANGWVLDFNVHFGSGSYGDQYVFRTLPELADWLKLQVVRDIAPKG